jgi:hypothetical protein
MGQSQGCGVCRSGAVILDMRIRSCSHVQHPRHATWVARLHGCLMCLGFVPLGDLRCVATSRVLALSWGSGTIPPPEQSACFTGQELRHPALCMSSTLAFTDLLCLQPHSFAVCDYCVVTAVVKGVPKLICSFIPCVLILCVL